MKIMLAGDVMLGRGIDQALPHPCAPEIAERYVTSALTYVALAERKSGPITRPVAFDYVWGDALKILALASPDVRIVNLETAITRRGRPVPKGIHYRMAPEHAPSLTAADIDCCVLANNHVLDWGEEGLHDTLETLDRIGIARVGAGMDGGEAEAPAVLALDAGRRLMVHAVGHPSSGVPPQWAASAYRPGVAFLPDWSEPGLSGISERIAASRRPGDLVVLSVHWGPNWGFAIDAERRFAHRLIDTGVIDLIHGHSSHHPKAIERYRGKLILYGCGDLLNDYEGIGGYEQFRPDLALVYLPQLDSAGDCVTLELLPFRIARFRLAAATKERAGWLADLLVQKSPAGLGIELVEATYGLKDVTSLSVTFPS
jgi:poly-gamma-glutamate synthesis protein (capsule biosynthesis protein)